MIERFRPYFRRGESLLLLAGVAFLFAASWSAVERPMIIGGLLLLTWAAALILSGRREPIRPSLPLLAALTLLCYDLIFPRIIHHPSGLYPVAAFARFRDLAWLALGGYFLWRVTRRPAEVITPTWFRWAVLAVTLVSGTILIIITPEPPIDVWEYHRQAGEVMWSGGNPYSEISVRSTFPSNDASRFGEGYPYTLVNLLIFGTAAQLAGDPRWASLLVWAGVLLVVNKAPVGDWTLRASVLFLVASQPAWPLMLEVAYSEPLTLLLLLMALVWVTSRPDMSAILMGLAIGSKQYLAALIPFLLVTPFLRSRYKVVAVSTGLLSLLSGSIWGIGEYLDAAFLFHLNVPPQEGSVNLFGLSSQLGQPVLMSSLFLFVVTLIASFWAGRNATSIGTFSMGMTIVLSIGFFFGSQAFANYWTLAAILALMSVVHFQDRHMTGAFDLPAVATS